MRRNHALLAEAYAVLWSLHEERHLAGVVRQMAQEIERLEEDNTQLQAALQIYREVTRVRGLNGSGAI